ncbi:MAG: dTMP kinase [Actinomycetia bacterium]|jgi:dTMP kinase|nr:dTMP kinase [Actinomycetes bacterium]MDQ1460994.1 dTMP kinase [Actinomycetota bacterium]
MTASAGRFIVVEGGEGVGKSTQVPRLAASLRASGREVVVTHEPGDTKLGAELRAVLLHADTDLDPRAELLLMIADRAQHLADVVTPALARGAIVVCDRYEPSTLAYQGVARGLGVERVERLSEFATAGVEPDVVVVLDLADEIAEARVSADRDRFERAGADFHARVRAAYRELAPARGWILVDADGTPDEVAARVLAAVSVVVP